MGNLKSHIIIFYSSPFESTTLLACHSWDDRELQAAFNRGQAPLPDGSVVPIVLMRLDYTNRATRSYFGWPSASWNASSPLPEQQPLWLSPPASVMTQRLCWSGSINWLPGRERILDNMHVLHIDDWTAHVHQLTWRASSIERPVLTRGGGFAQRRLIKDNLQIKLPANEPVS